MKNNWDKFSESELNDLMKFADGYKEFISSCKTERECASYIINKVTEAGFQNLDDVSNLKSGDKVYVNNRGKSVALFVIGEENIKDGINILGAHIDSPRLDLKPHPLYEDDNLAYLDTHYYGGVKKYQWVTIPLAIHGVVVKKDGSKINVNIGEDSSDPVVGITDLLIHLAKDQMKANANDFIDPEKMSVLIGSLKDKSAKDEKIKENILKILNEKYGIKEIDFARSEISFVPAFKAKYIGFDKSMIGGYGQDDRVCAYTTLRSLIDLANEKHSFEKTAIALIVDKEEIGSVGNTSMSSNTFDMFINKLIKKSGLKDVDLYEVYYNSKMLSADVSTCVDPDYEEVSDVQNGNILGCGIALEKYTGSGGKYSASDANAAFVAEVMSIFEKNNVMFQLGTLGKIGKGGGGTIAYILAEKGVNVIDCGTAVLAMHSPFEVTSKYDVYMTYLAYKAFFKA